MRLTTPVGVVAGLIAAGAAAGLLSISNPPADVGPLAFVALVPLLWALAGSRPARGALFGFAFALVYYGILLHWLLPFGVIAWLPLVVSQAAYLALFGALVPLLWRDDRPVLSSGSTAAAWTAVDWARSAWPLGGFTWGGLGYTQHGNDLLLPLASILGVWGVTFVLVACNALLLAALRSPRSRWPRTALLSAIVVGLAVVPALIPIPPATGPRLDVAVVQGNVPRHLAHDRYLQSRAVAENHIRLNRRLADDPPDVAIWPENSLDEDPTRDRSLGSRVARSIRAVGSPTLVGAVTEGPGDGFYNQALFYTDRGTIAGRYTKVHLVPFGEYVPWRSMLGWVDQLRAVPRDLIPGDRIRLFGVGDVRVGTPICFENTFPDLFRRFVAEGAGVVALLTNDSSFLESPASRQHVIMSQLRAVENARWVVQAAISGESAIIDPKGRVVARTGLFERAILRYDVPASTARTVYNRLGDWFPWACGAGALLSILAPSIRTGFERRRTLRGSSRPVSEKTRGRPLLPIGGGAPRVLVVLPTYNERPTIADVLTRLAAVAPNVDALVVDDASPDGTAEVVASMAARDPRLHLVRRDAKLGLASAYLRGFEFGLERGYDVLVEMDADLSHRPEDLPKLLEGISRYDVTIGSRYIPGGRVTNWSRARLTLSQAGNAYARGLLRLPVTDATSGYRAYRGHVLQALLDGGIAADGYAFQIELVYRASRLGFTIGEVPITFQEREYGRSKLSRRIVLEAVWRVGYWGVRDRLKKDRSRAIEGATTQGP